MQIIRVDQLKRYIEYLAAKDISGGYIPPNDFNDSVAILTNKMVRKYYGLPEQYQPGSPIPAISWEISQLVTDYLSQLKPTVILPVDKNGIATRPGDYLHKSSIGVSWIKVVENTEAQTKSEECCDEGETIQTTKAKLGKTQYDVTWVPVTVVSDNERYAWLGSELRKPTKEYPIAVFEDNDKIQFYPQNIKSVKFTYIRYPKTPKWNYTIVKGIPVYSATGSQDIELPFDCIDELAVTILDRIGITIREPGLVDWSRYIKTTGV
jgi:hypothetical protein